MRRKLILTMTLAFALMLTGCGGSDNKVDTGKEVNIGTEIHIDAPKDTPDSRLFSVYTGKEISTAESKKAPFLAVIENYKTARPQSGLTSADIIFETMAEGGIPRFLVLIQSQDIDKIGPIRSDRFYFNELSKTFNLPIAHCGGNQNALRQIAAGEIMSMNEMKNGSSYWRDKSRKAPHNLYTSTKKIRTLMEEKKYAVEPSSNLKFDESYWSNVATTASAITLKMSGYYTTKYRYTNGRYCKSMGNDRYMEAAIDKNNGRQVSTKNLIIQFTSIKDISKDHEHGVDIKLTGNGGGYVFSDGKYQKIKWSKKNATSQTEFTDANGNTVPLSPGSTMWDICDISSKLTIK